MARSFLGKKREHIYLEKFLVPYRSTQNLFGYDNIEWFCRSDCYIIFNKTFDIKIRTLLGILNSKLFYFGYIRKVKEKAAL